MNTVSRSPGTVRLIVQSCAAAAGGGALAAATGWLVGHWSFTTFGAPAPPAPTLTSAAGSDISSQVICSFLLRDALSTQPVVIIDELRIGASWASVTPPGPIPANPTLTASSAAAHIILSWPTNAPNFTLEAASTPVGPGAWSPVGATVYTVGDHFVVTNSLPQSSLFYRLRWP